MATETAVRDGDRLSPATPSGALPVLARNGDPETTAVIELRGDEDVQAVRALLAAADADRVVLVLPRGYAMLRSLVRLKLLARQAHEHGQALALVTRDAKTRELARELNLAIFRSVQVSERAANWRGGMYSGPGQINSSQEADLAWGRGRRAVLERRSRLGRGSDWGERIAVLALIAGLAVVLSAVLLLLVPSAQVTLIPRSEPVALVLPVTATTEADVVDAAGLLLPARIVSVVLEGTAQTAATGRRDVPDAPASGTVLFVNLVGEAVPVPAGTIVSTSSAVPVKFRTVAPVVVPAGPDERAATRVEAMQPGPTGNIRPLQLNKIEGPLGVGLRVLNPDPMEGGTVRQAAVVTAADKEQVREQLHNRLRQEALSELEARAPEDTFLLPDTLEIETVTESFDRQIDEQADVLTLLLRARAEALVVARPDLERLARPALAAQVPAGFVLLDTNLEVGVDRVEALDGPGARVAVRASGVARAQLDGRQIRSLVRGQPVELAAPILADRLPLAADPAVEVRPSWWGRMPYLPLRIFVRVARFDE